MGTRRGIGLVLFVSLFLLIIQPVSSDLSCTITTSCNAIDLLHLSDLTNAHAELSTQTNYNYKICCNSSTTISSSCSGNYVVFLKLSNTTNAHVEDPSQNNYAYSACIASSSWRDCTIATTCPSGYECLASISDTTNAHIGNCTSYSSKICCYVNTPPNITNPVISPDPAYTDSDLSCSVNVTDIDSGQSLSVNFSWYNGSNFYSSEVISASNGEIVTSHLTPLGVQNKNETWKCIVKAFDGYDYSEQKETSITISNSPPSKPTLLSPSNGGYTYDRTPLFSWSSTDKDNDPLTFEINITLLSGVCDNIPYYNPDIQQQNFTPSFELCTDLTYKWRVRARDSENAYSDWSDEYTFTLESLVNISLVNANIDFGTIDLGQEDDTTDDSPQPFIIENDGNIEVDINAYGENSLWTMASLGSNYFMFKADNSSELNSFNYSGSITSWVAVPNQSNQVLLIRQLDWHDTSDTAEIDVYVRSPVDEPPGPKSANIRFIGGAS